jgi:hypothetical protein
MRDQALAFWGHAGRRHRGHILVVIFLADFRDAP